MCRYKQFEVSLDEPKLSGTWLVQFGFEGMKLIQLTQGKSAIVDDADFEWLNQWKWRYTHGYARRAHYVDSRRVGDIHMHRLVNNTPDGGFDTDHINRNKLDNRRSNLRTATRSQNNFNTPAPMNNTSGVKGVWWSKQWKRWYAQIRVNGKTHSLGSSPIKAEAVALRLQAEERLCA